MNLESKINKIQDSRKKKLISTITSKKDWYKNINFDTYISIMQDLEYTIEEAKKIYISKNSNKDVGEKDD